MKGFLRLFGLGDLSSGGRQTFKPPPDASSTIGPGIVLKGEVRGEGTVVMLGRFEGDIILDGALHVGPDARVDANIAAKAIVVAGMVRGNLSAGTRVEILPTGSLTGTVKSGSFAAADGATVKGEVWVEPGADAEEAAP
jgi:cytoskeletal protein CcmA (bactofilin family)